MPRKACSKLMEEAKQRFPADLDYAVSLDQTLAVTEGMQRNHQDAVGSARARHPRRFHFPPRLARHAHSAVRRAGVAHRHVRFFPLFGFSINTLSLFGLVLAIGLVVDDAIVVVEAVEHHIEEGMSPRDAALQAMQEVSAPVIGIALVLSAVFIPTAFIPGITGRLYQQFALTIAISVIFSAFNALSLSPALVGAAASAAKKDAWPARLVFRLVQSRLRQRDARLRELVAARHSKGRAQFRVARCARGRRGIFRIALAELLPARRRPGLRLSRAAIPTPLRWSAPIKVCAQDRRHS